MSVHHTIGDIVKSKSLNEKFVRDCVKLLKDVLKPARGLNNALLFNNNAMAIFELIAQKRKNNWKMEQIESFIRKELNQEKPLPNQENKQVQTGTNQDEPDGQTKTNQKENSINIKSYEVLKLREKLLDQKEEFQAELFTQKEDILKKDRVILNKDIEIQNLNRQLLLLESPKNNSSLSRRNARVILWLFIVVLVLILIAGGYFVLGFYTIL